MSHFGFRLILKRAGKITYFGLKWEEKITTYFGLKRPESCRTPPQNIPGLPAVYSGFRK